MSLQVKPQEKKRRRKSSSLPLSSSIPSFSLLPDDITINYLARIPRAYYPRLSAVSKSFKSILSSSELYAERSHLGTTEHCLYVSMRENNRPTQWFTLWINPNRTLGDSCVSKKKTKGQLLVPIPSTNIRNSSHVVVGSEIYVIGGNIGRARRSSVVRILDCRTHTWRYAPRMKAACKYASSCVYNGKIYVLGGRQGLKDDKPWAEVFDTKTQTWECLPCPGTNIRRGFTLAEIKGKICFDNHTDAVITIYSYDPKQGKWEHCEYVSLGMFLLSDCVIENVSYSCRLDYHLYHGPFWISWYDNNVGTWKRVKGLESFQAKHFMILRTCFISSSKLVSCGGKLLLIWEEAANHSKKIWCAEIKVEKRDGGEIWGKIEWDDVVLTTPSTRFLSNCLSVSV